MRHTGLRSIKWLKLCDAISPTVLVHSVRNVSSCERAVGTRSSSMELEQLCVALHSWISLKRHPSSTSFQDVSFKWDEVVVRQVGDISFCFLITDFGFHWQKLDFILVPGK